MSGGGSEGLFLDCYGTNQKFSSDVVVLYDCSDNKFYVNGNPETSLTLYDDADGLQPTPPKNLQCTNPTSYGSHPNFSLVKPDHPKGVQFSYYIYRDEGSGFHQIGSTTSTSYTDTGAEIDKFGNPTYYYVKAKGSHSPLSDASNTVQLKTDVASKRLPGNDSFQDFENTDQSKGFVLSVSPNPFNPETKISYYLPREYHVRLSVFNITGQHIDTLVDQRQSAGKHTVQFSGQALPAGIYFVRLKLSNRQLTRQLLLFK